MSPHEKGAGAAPTAAKPRVEYVLSRTDVSHRIFDAALQGAMFGSAAYAAMTLILHLARALS